MQFASNKKKKTCDPDFKIANDNFQTKHVVKQHKCALREDRQRRTVPPNGLSSTNWLLRCALTEITNLEGPNQ